MTIRFAKSYSIIDHQLLHRGYLHRLSHEAMVLYLFLAVVGDKDGRSFYADTTIVDILRLTPKQLGSARNHLLSENLIEYHGPYFRVKNIQEGGHDYVRRNKTKNTLSARCNEADLSANRGEDRDVAENCLKNLSGKLSKKMKTTAIPLGQILFPDR